VGENIDKHRGNYLAETGKAIQIMRGIYVDLSSDVESTISYHAIRISKYLYPRAYLSAASAFLLGPTQEGKLYITGPRIQRTRIRNIEIIQNKAPNFPSLATAKIGDSMGEFSIEISSLRQRFLEAFRRRSEHSASIDRSMRSAMAERLIEEYGSADQAANALWALARQNEWYWEGEQAERYLKKGLDVYTVKNSAQLTLIVAWHGSQIGTLLHDGFEWRWMPITKNRLPLVRQTVPGKLPPFISSLLPEGWLENILKSEDERAALQNGKRYMSNITITDSNEDISALPADILETPLSLYSAYGVFTGRYEGPARGELEASFERNLANIYRSEDTPRLSGVQIKAPMFLDFTGALMPSDKKPFTHILKPAGTGGFEFLPLVEWLSLDLGRRIGFEVPDFALLEMPYNMPAALIVERFDIRRSPRESQQIALEDFCSLLDITAVDKYKGTIEQAGHALRAISTSPNDDLLTLLKRTLFAWLIADGDMHLKNLAVLKIAFPEENIFRSVRLAPLYDSVCTVIFPGLKNDRMALKLNGKDNRIKSLDFIKLSTTIGIRASEASALIEDTLQKLKLAVDEAALPDGIDYTDRAKAIIAEMLDVCRKRLADFS